MSPLTNNNLFGVAMNSVFIYFGTKHRLYVFCLLNFLKLINFCLGKREITEVRRHMLRSGGFRSFQIVFDAFQIIQYFNIYFLDLFALKNFCRKHKFQ